MPSSNIHDKLELEVNNSTQCAKCGVIGLPKNDLAALAGDGDNYFATEAKAIDGSIEIPAVDRKMLLEVYRSSGQA